jgi:hypothetical protein
MSFFRYDNSVSTTLGQAVAGASVAVYTQPATFPNGNNAVGTPLATIYSASSSNVASVTAAAWVSGRINFTLNVVPADVVQGAFISISAANPSGFNGIWQVFAVNGLVVTVQTPYQTSAPNPGTWVSGGTVATSVLPNPFFTDQLGNYFFYASQGVYTVQQFDPQNRVQPIIRVDQSVLSPGGGTVTSVGLTLPTDLLTVSGSPVISSGTLAGSKANVAANFVLCGPVSGAAAPWSLRALTANDIAALGAGSVTSVAASISGDPALTVSVTGSPITTNGTLAFTVGFQTQAANLVLASPTSGGTGPMTVRALVGADLPFPGASSLGGVESFTAPAHQFFTQLDTSGVFHSAQPAFTDISGTASNAQIPAPTTSALGGIKSLASATAHQFVTFVDSTGVQNLAQPAFTDISGTATNAQLPPAVSVTSVTTSSFLSVGTTITSYDGLTTAGLGVAPILVYAASTPATPIGATNILAAAPAGLYRVTVYSVVTTTGVGGTDFKFNLIYTDAFGAQTKVAFTNSTFTAGDVNQGDFIIQNQSTNNIQYSITEDGVFSTHPVLALKIALERIA